jgi:hypothetical protein
MAIKRDKPSFSIEDIVCQTLSNDILKQALDANNCTPPKQLWISNALLTKRHTGGCYSKHPIQWCISSTEEEA